MTRRSLTYSFPRSALAIIVACLELAGGNTGKMVYVLTPADSMILPALRGDHRAIEQEIGIEAGGSREGQTYNVAGLVSHHCGKPGAFGTSIDGLTQQLTGLNPPWTVEELTPRPSHYRPRQKIDVVHVFRIYNDVSV